MGPSLHLSSRMKILHKQFNFTCLRLEKQDIFRHRIYLGTGYCWLHCKTWGSKEASWKGLYNYSSHCLSLVEKIELAVHLEEEWHVCWWTWAWGCHTVSKQVHWLLEGIQEKVPKIWQWWKSNKPTHWLSCHSNWPFLDHLGYTWWVNVLCQWL